jgi:hypothetical protein
MSVKYPSVWLREKQIQKLFKERFEEAINRGWRVDKNDWLYPPYNHPMSDMTAEWLPFVHSDRGVNKIIYVPTYFWRSGVLDMEMHADSGKQENKCESVKNDNQCDKG